MCSLILQYYHQNILLQNSTYVNNNKTRTMFSKQKILLNMYTQSLTFKFWLSIYIIHINHSRQ